ncbi:gp53-like domain-containing protein [Oleidesulfovibrio sp.]|uniref:gp53-like domain-containing protein n=1 Tax=Oleidesulfovibrio sp. TaxID=2909707 RepID=UPI003A8BF37E
MHRIDSQGATAEGHFTEGNPTIPEPATVVSADWLNAVQDEILNVLAEADIQPDKAKNAQLKEAILKLGPERFKGFSTNGQHAAFEGDLNTVAHNSLYACDSAKVQNAPELPAGTWAFVHTMVLPADAGRTQLCWPADDPDHPGWNRRRTTTGQWSDWKVVGSGDAGVPVGMLCFSSTASPLPGTVAVNVKQKFVLGTFPQLEAWVQSSGGYLATEAEWDAEAAAQEGTCNKYCLTDTHIILPCYKHYFAAAQDGVAGKAVGDWAVDTFQQHKHDLSVSTNNQSGAANGPSNTGAFSNGWPNAVGGALEYQGFGTPRVSNETRPKTSYLLPCIKTYDVTVNAAQVDMQALAAQVAAINGNKVDRSEWTQTHAESGWQKLPSGLILQWGFSAQNALGSSVPVVFPITFPNQCFSVVVQAKNDAQSGDLDNGPQISQVTTTQFVSYNQNYIGGSGAPEGIYWQAIGY